MFKAALDSRCGLLPVIKADATLDVQSSHSKMPIEVSLEVRFACTPLGISLGCLRITR